MLAVLFLIPGQLYAGLARGCPGTWRKIMDEELRHKDYLEISTETATRVFVALLAGLLFFGGMAADYRDGCHRQEIWSW